MKPSPGVPKLFHKQRVVRQLEGQGKEQWGHSWKLRDGEIEQKKNSGTQKTLQ